MAFHHQFRNYLTFGVSLLCIQCVHSVYYRTATARGKAEQADIAALQAREDSDLARDTAKQFAPDFYQPGIQHVYSICLVLILLLPMIYSLCIKNCASIITHLVNFSRTASS